MQRAVRRSTAFIALEGVLIFGVVMLSGYLAFGADMGEAIRRQAFLPKAFLVALVCQLCFYYGDLYDFRLLTNRRDLFVHILQSLGASALVLAAVYLIFPALVIGRGVFVTAATFLVTAFACWRVVVEWFMSRIGPRTRLLLVGISPAAEALARELGDRKDLGIDIVGFVETEPMLVERSNLQAKVIGTIEDIPAIVRARSIDRVVVSLADARGKLPMSKLLDMKLDGVTFDHLASVYEEYTGKIAVENLRPSWLIFSSGFQKTRRLKAAKRLADVVIAVVGLLFSLPLMLVIGALVKLTSPGPAVYRQQRVGLDGRVFTIWKFRSMRNDAEAVTGAVWATPGDSRVTKIGRHLRRMRLDEIPQLWNVLIGDMSLIGPRPERPEFVKNLTREIAFYGQRHVIKPGLTGWAQIRYTYGASVEDAMQKLQYDFFYIKNMSLALDFYIIVQTVKIVIRGRGAY